LSELLIDGTTALTVPLQAPRLLAQRVLDLRANPQLATTITAQGREHVAQLFSPARFVAEFERLYGAVTARANVHAPAVGT
jgi:glycosyltransferase involved in cell wall biosynthesis